MGRLKDFLGKLKARSIVDGSVVNVPVGGGFGDLSEAFDVMLDPENKVPLAIINHETNIELSILSGLSKSKHRADLKGFVDGFTDNYLRGSVSVQGVRSTQLTSIASGYYGTAHGIEVDRLKDTDNKKRGPLDKVL